MIIDLFGLFTLVGIGYYASRIMVQMRTGLLEKSWRYLVAASIVLLCGVVLFIAQQFVNSSVIVDALSHVSALLMVIGGIYILLGFRSHYMVFNPKHPKTDTKKFVDQ